MILLTIYIISIFLCLFVSFKYIDNTKQILTINDIFANLILSIIPLMNTIVAIIFLFHELIYKKLSKRTYKNPFYSE